MKFALYEFVNTDGGNGLHVGESCWIVDFDDQQANNTDFDFDEEILVNWPSGSEKKKGAQIYAAKVHRFSGLFLLSKLRIVFVELYSPSL